jgi:hypothetical protein
MITDTAMPVHSASFDLIGIFPRPEFPKIKLTLYAASH